MRLLYLGMNFKQWLYNTTCFVTPHQLRQIALPNAVLKKLRVEQGYAPAG